MRILIPVVTVFLLSVATFTALPAQSSVYVEPATEDIHVGDVFLVELKAHIQEPIATFQMYLDWDDAMFAFHEFSVEDSALPGMLPEFIATPDVIQQEGTSLSISWFQNSFQAVAIDSGAVVLSFWLEAIDCGTSRIKIVPTQFNFTEIYAEDASGNLYNIDVAEIDATVEIPCDTLPDPVVDCENPLNCVEQITVELSDNEVDPMASVHLDDLHGVPDTDCIDTSGLSYNFIPEVGSLENEGILYTCNELGESKITLNALNGNGQVQESCGIEITVQLAVGADPCENIRSLDEWSLQQLLDDAPTRFPENELRLFDALGRQVYYAQPYDGRPLSAAALPSGVYYYVFRPEASKPAVQRGAAVIAR